MDNLHIATDFHNNTAKNIASSPIDSNVLGTSCFRSLPTMLNKLVQNGGFRATAETKKRGHQCNKSVGGAVFLLLCLSMPSICIVRNCCGLMQLGHIADG